MLFIILGWQIHFCHLSKENGVNSRVCTAAACPTTSWLIQCCKFTTIYSILFISGTAHFVLKEYMITEGFVQQIPDNIDNTHGYISKPE